jgi:hypothetical protein
MAKQKTKLREDKEEINYSKEEEKYFRFLGNYSNPKEEMKE